MIKQNLSPLLRPMVLESKDVDNHNSEEAAMDPKIDISKALARKDPVSLKD